MANAVMTETSFGSAGTNTIVTLIADQFISSLRNRVRPLNYVRSVGDKLSAGGDTIRVPLSPTVTSSLMSDGAAVTLDDTPGSTVSITLNKHRQCSFGSTLISQAKTEGTATIAMQMESRLNAMFNDVESDVLTVATTGFTTNTAGSYNSNLTEANIITGITGGLIGSRVPQDKPLMALVHHGSTAWQALAAISNFASASARGANQPSPLLANGDPVAYGQMVPFQGAYWSICQSINKSGTSTDNIVFYPDAICVAFRAIPLPSGTGVEAANFIDTDSRIAFQIVKSWNKDRLAEEVTIHCLYGYGVGRESWGLLLKS